jgi:hypothetical protein
MVMAKSVKRKTGTRLARGSSKSMPDRSVQVTHRDIALRAYLLYLARGCEHGHDVDDWLQAERELQDTLRSNAT